MRNPFQRSSASIYPQYLYMDVFLLMDSSMYTYTLHSTYLAWSNHQTFLQSLDEITQKKFDIKFQHPSFPPWFMHNKLHYQIYHLIALSLQAIIRLISRAWDGAGRTIVFHGTWHWFFFPIHELPIGGSFTPPHATVSLINDIPLSMSNMFLSC